MGQERDVMRSMNFKEVKFSTVLLGSANLQVHVNSVKHRSIWSRSCIIKLVKLYFVNILL